MSERQKEIRRRRKRRANYAGIKAKIAKADGKLDATTKQKIADKLRRMTPGADVIINALDL
ncbi:MAG: hypothetical protein LBQ66_09895 [Planctomycetaceae bacterium]|jgi:uncharacterized membrane protein YebE (DUF533 family)|nr:hypothetical protein [Planctomycetaceae bacterium]